jgi:hypothetical protein
LNFISINTNLDLSQLDISEVNIVPKYGKFFELQIIYKKKKKKERKKKMEKKEGNIDAPITNHSNDVSFDNKKDKERERNKFGMQEKNKEDGVGSGSFKFLFCCY